jgi:hypothetical protein
MRLAPRLRMSGALPRLCHIPPWRVQRQLYLHYFLLIALVCQVGITAVAYSLQRLHWLFSFVFFSYSRTAV